MTSFNEQEQRGNYLREVRSDGALSLARFRPELGSAAFPRADHTPELRFLDRCSCLHRTFSPLLRSCFVAKHALATVEFPWDCPNGWARRRVVSPVQRSQSRRRPLVPKRGEMAAGVPAPAAIPDAATAEALTRVRRVDGAKVADSESAAILGRLGGLAKAERDRALAETPTLVRKLGLREVTSEELLPYLDDAETFAEAECARLAALVGGGECGFGPSSMVQSAALQLAGSRCAFARGDLITGSRLADASRANLMSARDECAREATARVDSDATPPPWFKQEAP